MLAGKAAELERADRVEDLWTGIRDTLATYGIPFLNYLTVDKDMRNPVLLSNIREIYGEQAPENDPFLSHCCQSYDITLTGVQYLPDYAYLPDAAKRFITAARETGFQTGIGIPMRLKGSERFGGFNLGTRMERAEFEKKILPRQEEFRIFCLIVHRRIEELMEIEGASDPTTAEFRGRLISPGITWADQLTTREQEIAYLVASGMSRKECARLCSITPNTVSGYVKSIYRKLEINDRVQLARLFNEAPTSPAAPLSGG